MCTPSHFHSLVSIAITSSACESGFSQIIGILTPFMSSLETKTISSLLLVRINGPPLQLFVHVEYVDSWIIPGHSSALDTN